MFELTKYTAHDRPLYAQLVFNEAVMRQNYGRIFTVEEAELLFNAMLAQNAEPGLHGYYKVIRRADGAYLGLCGLSPNEEGATELEYMLLPAYWGQGYATRLVAMQVAALRKAFPLRPIIALADPANVASAKVLERNGFVGGPVETNGEGEAVRRFVLPGAGNT